MQPRRVMAILLSVLHLSGCADAPRSASDQRAGPRPGRERGVTLKRPIGITTVAGSFTPLVEAGQHLPHTHSETFTNKTDGGPEILVELSQKDESGIETIASLVVPIPRVPDNALQITVTLRISADKEMTVKVTVAEPATVREFGPFPVE